MKNVHVRKYIFRNAIFCTIAKKSPNFYENRRFCKKIADFVKKITETSVKLEIYIKRRLYAQLGDFRLKTGGVPPF